MIHEKWLRTHAYMHACMRACMRACMMCYDWALLLACMQIMSTRVNDAMIVVRSTMLYTMLVDICKCTMHCAMLAM